MTTYKNSFYVKGDRIRKDYSEFFITDVAPIEYRGYLIYHYTSLVWHIVKDGICIHMYAGINGAKRKIDELLS